MSQPRDQSFDTRQQKGGNGGAAFDAVTDRVKRTLPGDFSAVHDNGRLPDHLNVVVASSTPVGHHSAVDATRTPPSYVGATDSNRTLPAQLSIGPSVNGPGLMLSSLHQLMGIGAVQTPPFIGRTTAPTVAMVSSRSPLIAGQDIALCDVNPISQDKTLLLQTMRQQHQQHANLAAAVISSRVAFLPPLSTNFTSNALAMFDTARANFAVAPERLMHQATPQNMSTTLTEERLASALLMREGDLSPPSNTFATPVAKKTKLYLSDASSISESVFAQDDDDDQSQVAALKKSSKLLSSSLNTFPFKLFRMLAEAEMNGDDDIVSFFPHGRAFAVHSPRKFVSKLMPKYFSTTRMPSFQRQLNLYGFQRITDGQDKGGYFHEYFLRRQRDLCKKIRRKTSSRRRPTTPDSTEDSIEEEFTTEAHSCSFVAASRTALDQVVLARLSQQVQQQNLVASMPQLPQDSMNCLVEGIGRPAQPRPGIPGTVADGRKASEMVTEQLRSDVLHRMSVAQQLQHEAGGNSFEHGKDEGIDQSEDSNDVWTLIKKRRKHN